VASVNDPEGDAAPEAFHTPGVKTIAELAAFAGVPETSLIKSVVMHRDGQLVLALVRGDHQVKGEVQAATAEEIRAAFGAEPGSLGPVGLKGVRVIADEALRGRRNMICGANRDDYHLRNVTPGRDFTAEFRELRVEDSVGSEGVPVLAGGAVLGSVKESAAGLAVLNESGSTFAPGFVFGELALDRVLASVGRDESGLVMPPRIAPFSVAFVVVNAKDAEQAAAAHRLYEAAREAGCDAVLDDRDERPGVKFKDCELVGIPWRVTVGKKLAEGLVEVFERHSRQSWDVAVGEAVEFVRDRWDVVA
jgi:prolyl-tRNA synthetase